MVQRICEIDSGITVGERLLDALAILDRDVLQPEEMPQHCGHLRPREAVVTPHDPLEFEDDGLADHQWLSRFDQPARSHTLARRLGITHIVDVVTRQDIRVEPDHRFVSDAGSRSAGTARRLLLSIPKPLSESAGGELRTRITTCSPTNENSIRVPCRMPNRCRSSFGMVT